VLFWPLDANRASYLNDSIDRLVREGHYVVALDLEQVDYLILPGSGPGKPVQEP
jgi:hypothetical protein